VGKCGKRCKDVWRKEPARGCRTCCNGNMTNNAIKKIIATIRQHLGILSDKGDLAVLVRQAVVAKILGHLTEIEAGLE
jgi:hypothetical protein